MLRGFYELIQKTTQCIDQPKQCSLIWFRYSKFPFKKIKYVVLVCQENFIEKMDVPQPCLTIKIS